MEERFGQLQCDYRGGRRSSMSMRYPFQEVDDGAPSRHAHYASASTSASPCAPVPLQPWDHQAILDYRNRVNANSNAHAHPRRNDLHHHHYLHMRSAVLLEEADRLRWSRFRDVSRSRSPSPSRIRRQQDYRDWRFRDHQPQFYHHQVCPPSAPAPSPNPNPNPNPNPALEQGGLFRFGAEKRARLEDDDDQFRIRKRSKFLHYEYDYDHPLFPPSAAPPLLAPPPPPPRDMYLPSPRVKWQHDLFEHAHTNIHSMMEERERERERNVVSFGLSIAGGGGGGGGGGFDDFMAVQNDLSKGVEVQVEVEVEEEVEVEDSRRTLTSLLSDLKDQVLASTPSVGGLQQSETRKGKIHIKGQNGNVGNMQSKKLKNKIPSSTQTTQKKVKPKKNPPHSLPAPAPASASVEQRKMLQNGSLSHLLESTSQCEQSSEAKYERSTADLSVVFRRSGMVAQEVVTSLVNNQPDYTGTKSSASKVLIQQEDIEEEEGEIKIVESQNIFFEEKRSEDHQNVGSQSKTKSMKPTSEAISSEKDLIIQGNSVEPPCYLEGLENKIGTTSATQSQERSIPTGNYFSLDCRGNDSPATLKANQSDNGLPSVESLPTCAPLLKLHNDLSINAPSEPNLTSRVMQEVGYQDTPLTLSICKAIEKSDAKERLQKKLKVEQREKLPLYDNIRMEGPLLTSSVLQLHTDVTESQGAITGDQVLLNGTMISNASHQCSGVCQIQSSQAEERMLSQNAILVPTLPQSRLSITCLPTRAKVVASSMLAGRSRTWHRTDNATSSSVLVRPLVIHNDATSGGKEVTKVEKSQSAAYVRKGNSLVRATYPPIGLSSSKSSSARPLNTGKTLTWKSSPLKGISATGDINNVVTGLGTNVGSNRPPSATEFWFSTPAFERPSTPSVVPAFKSPVCSNVSPQSLAPTAVSNTPIEGHVLTTNAQDEDDFKVIYDNIPSVANVLIEHPMHDPLNNLSLCKRNRNEDHLEKAGAAQMIYVKQMSNQLIATPTCKSQGSTASIGEGGQLPPNCLVQDHYFKRKKNQLVRSNLPMDRKITKSLEVPGVSSSLDTELKVTTLKDQRGMTFFQTKLGRVLKQKKHWTLQSSWVWTLGKAESSNAPLLQSRRLAPLLFPWKRPSYGKSGLVGKLKAVPSISKGSSLSLISKKLNCLRKRDTVYTKSLNGFSLHRSGVLSLGGSNLKWSKSIEKRSKQASEEITIAVAAAERKRREVKAVCDVITSASKENAVRQSSKPARGIKQRARKSKQATGERIVQVGLFRYKMDPSKRTLQMIPAEESTSSFNTSLASHTIDTTKPITPKRVSIGGDEYLRVGNGNQLVRDPKKVCRVLASEKVRWSLHTARRRLAKKQQYCQFFTRFGKCNKEDGKCSYIHDREKVAVCTKFLKGACSNANCELTHKIIPERMEDCSYFLQGFCTNENCPYRHVNVNPNAPVCDGFLKGYCAEGDKCNKKHTYVCPQYAATGECPERLSCKLHHPKKKDKPKGSGRHKGCIISKRRYFVADDLGISELASTLFRLHSEQQTTLEFPSRAPECVEFISLDAPEEDVDDNNLICGALSPMKRPETDFLSNIGLPVDDIDMMIKPIRLLQKEQAFNT